MGHVTLVASLVIIGDWITKLQIVPSTHLQDQKNELCVVKAAGGCGGGSPVRTGGSGGQGREGVLA